MLSPRGQYTYDTFFYEAQRQEKLNIQTYRKAFFLRE